jgi:hypothetical protein
MPPSYQEYFHALMKNHGASQLHLVRDDAITERVNPTEDKRSQMVDMGLPSCPSRKPSCENLFNLREPPKDTELPDLINHEKSSGEQLRSHSFDQRKTRWSSAESLTGRDALERFAEDVNPDFSNPIHPSRNSMANDSSFRASNPFLKHKRCRWSATPMC